MSEYIQFPSEFLWGTATSAYQIEGAVAEGGRGPSIWDTYCKRPGKIYKGQTGEIACDHYHLYKDDVALMKQMGLQAYRFSISWSRVMPAGRGKLNTTGINYYRSLLTELRAAGIRPFVTLYHWDLPQTLYEEYGGFMSRNCAHDFADYAAMMARELGDLVSDWITINEPWEHACMGHMLGEHAPGRHSPRAYFHVMHNLLLGHGLAARRIKEIRPEANVGITLSMTPIHPATDTEKDRQATRLANEFMNHIALGPLLKGEYPRDLWKRVWLIRPRLEKDDMKIISEAPLDFLGLNNYSREWAAYKWYVPFINAWVTGKENAPGEFVKNGVQHTSMGWEVYPEGLGECLQIIRDEYGNPPVYITENGAAFDDRLEDGRVHDEKRIDYLRAYLKEARRAIEAGSDLRGYFVWSFMDNFEWAVGYAKRFGLVYTNYETRARVIKDSGHWYGELIRQNQPAYRT